MANYFGAKWPAEPPRQKAMELPPSDPPPKKAREPPPNEARKTVEANAEETQTNIAKPDEETPAKTLAEETQDESEAEEKAPEAEEEATSEAKEEAEPKTCQTSAEVEDQGLSLNPPPAVCCKCKNEVDPFEVLWKKCRDVEVQDLQHSECPAHEEVRELACARIQRAQRGCENIILEVLEGLQRCGGSREDG